MLRDADMRRTGQKPNLDGQNSPHFAGGDMWRQLSTRTGQAFLTSGTALVLVLTGYGTAPSAVAAAGLTAADMTARPSDPDQPPTPAPATAPAHPCRRQPMTSPVRRRRHPDRGEVSSAYPCVTRQRETLRPPKALVTNADCVL
jgi:hypothetical protein